MVVLVMFGAGPALADPAAPTNYESTVLGMDPPSNAAVVRVTGGDAFLEVIVVPGHEFVVPGYFGEPYIRIDADGTVWVNEDSPAHYINDDRYGTTTAPEEADGRGAPRWVRVGEGGRYAWHDHRIHWMSYDRPPTVSGESRQVVFPWSLPVVVDGTETRITGELAWIPSRSVVAPLLAGMIALLPLVAAARYRSSAIALLIVGAAALAAVVAVAQANGTPAPARGFPVMMVLPLVALIAGLWAIAGRTPGSLSPTLLTLTAGLALAAWALATAEVLWLPILPSALPRQLERFAVAFVFWAGVGAVVAAAAESAPGLRRTKTPSSSAA